MKYRVKLAQIRTVEVELDAPAYDIAHLRALDMLNDAEWKLWKVQTERMEKEPFEESLEHRHKRQREFEQSLQRNREEMFGEPTKGDLFAP
jgi:hypothetical protein